MHTEPHAEPLHYGISPYLGEGRKQRGWKLDIRRRGVLFHRRFNARDFGGLDGAPKAALALRDETEREDGTPLRRYFSVPRHGDSEAKRLAIAQRTAWEAQRARGEPYTVQHGGGRAGC